MQVFELNSNPIWYYLTFDWYIMIERIKEIISYSGLSDRAFAIKCGLAQNTLNRQLNGVRELSLVTVNAILTAFDNISSEWLLRGKGTMLLSNIEQDPNIERMNRLVDTITTLQGALNEKDKTIKLLEEKAKRLEAELAMIKNERKIG